MKIEKNIPIPQKKMSKNEHVVRQMEIGDSVFFDVVEEDLNRHHDYTGKTHSNALAFVRILKKCGMKAIVRIARDENHKLLGFRVWRVE
tara:strand:+ start:51 stop:317 length:267 start_codon:yes stop_codon:yes gene_type:complete